jgi:hypothetical protein
MQVIMDQLRKKGFITKDPTREKLWLHSKVVKQMCTALVTDAIENGTHSWDVTCSKVLSFILQAALGSRAGDVAKSTRYSDADCLNWKHVLIKLVPRNDGTKN